MIMKKAVCILISILTVLSLAACAGDTGARSGTVAQAKGVDDVLASASAAATSTPPAETQSADLSNVKIFSDKIPAGEKYDVDLTKLNATMVYTKVSDMISNPDNYVGKRVKMDGTFAVAETEARNYYACLIADATACCSQGIEFVTDKQFNYPDDYPPKGTEIIVTGIFDTYFEGTNQYFQLINASVYNAGA